MSSSLQPVAQPKPQAAYVYVARPNEAVAQILQEIIGAYLKGKKSDKFKEWSATVIAPEDTNREWNGGFWAEGFKGEVQIPHTHADDGKNAKERYLLLCAKGGDGKVEIVHNGKVERYFFPKDHLCLLHFDGSEPHKFSIDGDDKARLLSFAIHTRDVATDERALETQTVTFNSDLSQFPKEEFRLPEIPMASPSANEANKVFQALITELSNARIAHVFETSAGRRIGTTRRTTEASVIASLASAIAQFGQGYGNKEKFGDISSIDKRHDSLWERSSR